MNLYPFKNIVYLFVFVLFIGACEDVVDIQLEEGKTELVVDAWINDLPQDQVIKLRRTSPYFEAVASPRVTGASVTVSNNNNGNTFSFTDEDNDGDYTWEYTPGSNFITIGEDYQLSIFSDGNQYIANSTMNRVPPVDSITLEDREKEFGFPAGIYAEFFSRDFLGIGDCYWIKTFKNDSLLNKPQEINIAYDAGFSAGSEVDGLIFIPPIRDAMNRIPDSGTDAVDDFDVPPWASGDSIRVEIHSLTEPAFFYWERARIQLTLGDASIFAEPPSNIPTNISCSDLMESPQGFFNVAAVSSLGRKVE